LDEACQESERDRAFFRNVLRIITSKVVYILEKCDKRQKVYGKIRSSGVAENFTPCSRGCHHQDYRLCCPESIEFIEV